MMESDIEQYDSEVEMVSDDGNSSEELMSDRESVEAENISDANYSDASEAEPENISDADYSDASEVEPADMEVEQELDNAGIFGEDNGYRPFFHSNPTSHGMGENLQTQWKPYDWIVTSLSKSVRMNETFSSIVEVVKIFRAGFESTAFPKTKETLWKRLGKNEENVDYYSWCLYCGHAFGKTKKPDNCTCPRAQQNSKRRYIGQYAHISVRAQLIELLRRPKMSDALKYRDTRIKWNAENYEDIYDGASYRESREEGFLANSNNFSLDLWVDAISASKSSKATVTPALLMLNELSPNARKRHMIMAGVYSGPKKFYSHDMLRPLMEELDSLFRDGITWAPFEGGPERTSKFTTCIFAADSEGRWELLNMHRHNGMELLVYIDIKKQKVNGNKDIIFLN